MINNIKICNVILLILFVPILVIGQNIQNHQLQGSTGSGYFLRAKTTGVSPYIREFVPPSSILLSEFNNDLDLLETSGIISDYEIPYFVSGNLETNPDFRWNNPSERLEIPGDGRFINIAGVQIRIGKSNANTEYGEITYNATDEELRFRAAGTIAQGSANWDWSFIIDNDNRVFFGDNTSILFSLPSNYPLTSSDWGIYVDDDRDVRIDGRLSLGLGVFDPIDQTTEFDNLEQGDYWGFNETTYMFEPMGITPPFNSQELTWNTATGYTLSLTESMFNNALITCEDAMDTQTFSFSNPATEGGTINVIFYGDPTNVGDVEIDFDTDILASDVTNLGNITVPAGKYVSLSFKRANGNYYVINKYPLDDNTNNVKEITSFTAGKYTVVTDDKNKYLRVNNATAVNVIVDDTAADFPIGATIDIEQMGAGDVTIAGLNGTTINTADGLKIGGQYKVITLKKVATNTWTLIGGSS